MHPPQNPFGSPTADEELAVPKTAKLVSQAVSGVII